MFRKIFYQRPLKITKFFLMLWLFAFMSITYAEASSVAEIIPLGNYGTNVFSVGVELFSDRNFVLTNDYPSFLEGSPLIQGSIDSTRFRVVQDGILTILTPDINVYGCSQYPALEAVGFIRIMTPETFQPYGTLSGNIVRIYQKGVRAGEYYEFDKWTIVLASADEGASQEWGDVLFSLNSAPADRWDQNTGEILYNGIQLPQVWPPIDISSSSPDPMPVPYLDYPPEVISIDVGRQLLFDDFLIETTDLSRTFHYPTKYSGNPVLEAETYLEEGAGVRLPGACPKSGGLWWDPNEQVFELWYEAGWLGKICYATSTNGLDWDRPDLDVVPGSNQVMPEELQADSGAIIRDWWTDDPAEKYKIFARRPGGGHGAKCFVSPDGIHWGDSVMTGEVGDRSTMFYNPFRRKWVYSIRSWFNNERARHYWEGDNIMTNNQWASLWATDQQPVVWASVDNLDTPDPVIQITPQLYNLDAVAYESIMLGLFQIWRGPENEDCGGVPKITELNFAYSRDGFHWDRPDRTTAVEAEQVSGAWDRGYVQSLSDICVIQGDELWFYYAGYEGDVARTNDGMYANGAMGIAVLRRDGFASMDTSGAGSLLTRPVTFNGKCLFVNAAVSGGSIRAEILDENNVPIEPFTLGNSVPSSGDSTLQQLSWTKGGDLSVLSGRPVRFRFVLENGELYSFWVSKDETGRSDGYVAGGGPGYLGPTDTVGAGALEANKKSVSLGLTCGQAGFPVAMKPTVLMAGDEYKGVDLGITDQSSNGVITNRVVVKESQVINRPDVGMLGYNHNWLGNDCMTVLVDGKLVMNSDYLQVLKGVPLPLNRVSGSQSQRLHWKEAVGAYEKRVPQQMVDWKGPVTLKTGPIEWLKTIKQLDPSSRVVWVVNMMDDTAQDNADLIEFLTGDGTTNPNGGVNWAQRRIELGIKEPVFPVLIELGNELDWGKERAHYPIDTYIRECRERMAAMRAVWPEVKFAAHAATAPWSEKHTEIGGWRNWHFKVLKELGAEIDFITIHPYYHGFAVSTIEQDYMKVLMADIREVTGSDRIKIYVSEHARWPSSLDEEDRFQTRSLEGALATGEWINRMLQYPQVKYMGYHSLSAGPWGLVYPGGKNGFYLSAMADFFQVYYAAFGEEVCFSRVAGEGSGPADRLMFTVNVMRSGDELRLICMNRSEMAQRELSLQFEGTYSLVKTVIFSGNSLDAVNDDSKKEVITSTVVNDDSSSFSSCTVEAKSMTVFYLKEMRSSVPHRGVMDVK